MARQQGFSRSTLSGRLSEVLKSRILEGDIPQGSVLDETELTYQYEVSRNVVRDAILRLVKEGLVTKQPHKRAYVRSFTEQDISEIFDVRLGLELIAIEKAIITRDGVTELKRLIEEEKQAVRKGVVRDYIRIDSEFHYTLVCFSRNQTLIEVYKQIKEQIQVARVAMNTWRPERMQEANKEHIEILNSIITDDREAAKRLLRHHIEFSKQQGILGLIGSDAFTITGRR